MLGVEVFRDKQGLGQKLKDEGKEEVAKDAEEEVEAVENEAELDSENGDENGSSQPKVDSGSQGTSSWECRGDGGEKGGLTEDVLELEEPLTRSQDHIMWLEQGDVPLRVSASVSHTATADGFPPQRWTPLRFKIFWSPSRSQLFS